MTLGKRLLNEQNVQVARSERQLNVQLSFVERPHDGSWIYKTTPDER